MPLDLPEEADVWKLIVNVVSSELTVALGLEIANSDPIAAVTAAALMLPSEPTEKEPPDI
jgi:hypothetical protein